MWVRMRSATAIAAGITASWGLVHGIANLLIEDAMGFMAPLDAGQRQAVIDDALERLIGAFELIGAALGLAAGKAECAAIVTGLFEVVGLS